MAAAEEDPPSSCGLQDFASEVQTLPWQISATILLAATIISSLHNIYLQIKTHFWISILYRHNLHNMYMSIFT